jgi:signal transduction histidine kinase
VAIEPPRILVVEDDSGIARLQQKRLERAGYAVLVEGSTEAARRVIESAAIDMMLVDHRLPGPQTGLAFYQQLKADGFDVPTILVTGFSNESLVIEALRAGVRDFVTKSPEFLEYLPEAIARTFQHLQKEAEAAEARRLRELADSRATLLEELERANRELEAFSYSVSHDLRAPLRAIRGFAQIVINDFAQQLDPGAQAYLGDILDNAQKMGHMIDDLLAFSQLGRAPLRTQRVDLAELVGDVLESLQTERAGRHIEISVGDLGGCDADPRLLRQALINLIGNAIKFTRRHEQATIEIGRLECDTGKPPTYFVKDNGAGFDPRYAAKLFGVFQRLHRHEDFEGTGVGLAIVQRIINRHGGRVWAQAQIGQGATFFFTLSP